MTNWKKSEIKGFNWFKNNIDPNAKHLGKENSTCGDIFSPLYNTYIEVKDISQRARCGQFNEATIKNNPFAQRIYDGDFTPDACRKFVQYHYTKKNVTHFIVIDEDNLFFYNFEEFFTKYIFEVQTPYKKRSGTSPVPKKDIPALLQADKEFILGENNRVYCYNSNKWGSYVSINNLFDYFISKTNKGELRKRSSIQNMTWHLIIKSLN
jgi:hypothetical protein